MAKRLLTAGEGALADSVFGAALDRTPVRLDGRRLPFQPPGMVMAPWNTVFFGSALRPDFSRASVPERALFLHELTHCAQHQAGMNLVLRGMAAHAGAFLTRRSPYDYAPGPAPLAGRPFEHQAAMVEDLYRVLHAMPPRRPAARPEDLARALGHRDLASAKASLSLGAPPLLRTPLR